MLPGAARSEIRRSDNQLTRASGLPPRAADSCFPRPTTRAQDEPVATGLNGNSTDKELYENAILNSRRLGGGVACGRDRHSPGAVPALWQMNLEKSSNTGADVRTLATGVRGAEIWTKNDGLKIPGLTGVAGDIKEPAEGSAGCNGKRWWE